MITNSAIAENTCRRLVDFLKSKGVDVFPYDATLHPIEKTLCYSWYVKKVKEMGHTDCCHIGLVEGGFFAVLENSQIMTGSNIMILDAISGLCCDNEVDPNEIMLSFRWKGFGDGCDGVLVVEFSELKKAIDLILS